jgi:hypothetical protein
MTTRNIPTKDLDLETLLGIAERMSTTGAVSLLKTTTGWGCKLAMIETTVDGMAGIQWCETPEEALVAVIVAAPRSRVSG